MESVYEKIVVDLLDTRLAVVDSAFEYLINKKHGNAKDHRHVTLPYNMYIHICIFHDDRFMFVHTFLQKKRFVFFSILFSILFSIFFSQFLIIFYKVNSMMTFLLIF